MSLLPVGIGSAEEGGYQIERSLRFNSADSAYLNRTLSTSGSLTTWTWSAWVKRSGLGSVQVLFSAGTNGVTYHDIYFNSDDTLRFLADVSGTPLKYTTQVFRDTSAWYHIVGVWDTPNATADDRMRLYVNGVRITAFSTSTNPTSSQNGLINNSSYPHAIGRRVFSSSNHFSGYLTEINFIDGSALTPSSFGEFNTDTGVWQPKAYTGSYGTQGWYLDFSDNSGTTSTTLGKDQAGSNNWTPNNFSVTAGAGNDSLVDSPTRYGTDTGAGGTVRGNYATLNALDKQANASLQQGNLEVLSSTADAQWKSVRSTIYTNTGKVYFEGTLTTVADGNWAVGLADETFAVGTSNAYVGNSAKSYSILGIGTAIYKYNNGSSSTLATGISQSANDVFMVAIDYDAGKIWLGRNGTWYGSGDPSAGTNEAYSITANTNLTPAISAYRNVNSSVVSVNFGQRPFAYTAPSGFKALVTTNLPEPTIKQGDDYFNTVLYTGNGSTQSITGVGFQPDWVWLKTRSADASHTLTDAVRGVTKEIYTNSTSAEQTNSQGLTSFDSNGFTLGSNVGINFNGRTYVAWNWKANGAGSTNTAGTITSTVSVNTTSGFSIVTYTGNNSSGSTVGHGLGVTPSFIIIKSRSAATRWLVKAPSITGTNVLALNQTAAAAAGSNGYIGTLSSTTFQISGISTNNDINALNATYVAYCFAPVAGYSAFGSYTGNGSADGPFLYTGFRPRWVLTKVTAGSGAPNSWVIHDTARDTYNYMDKELFPDASTAEQGSNNRGMDCLSNGFKVRSADNVINTSGGTYIYAAFAENPFAYSLAR
jgi:hypothetical protein